MIREVLKRHPSYALPRKGFAVIASRRSLPLVIAASWWAVCFALYALAWPIAYTHRNFLGVTALMAGTTACAIVGYFLGVGRKSLEPEGSTFRVPLPVVIGFLGSLALVIPMIATYSGFGFLDLGKAIANQSEAYNLATQRIAEGFSHRRAVVVAETVLAPFTLGVLPFLALSWFEARKHGLMLLVGLAAPIYVNLLEGRSVALGTAGIVVVGAWVISRVRRQMPLRRLEVGAAVLIALVSAAAFGAQKLARISGSPICPPGTKVCTAPNAGFIEGTWVLLASYASQGLEGLGHALDAKWSFGGGFSHSPAVKAMLVALFHSPPAPVITTQLQALGWSDTKFWSSALPSVANDVPWPLVPVIIGMQVGILGVVWRSAVERADWLSVTLFCFTWLSVLFIPQNLQIAISGPTYIGYVVLIIWYFVRAALARRSTRFGVAQETVRIGSRANE